MAHMVLGVFSDRENAEEAISELESRGYNPKDMSILMKDTSEARELSEDTSASQVVGGTASGLAAGAVLGGLAGLVASFVIPGLGAFFIGGPLATALGLTGAAATTASGAATGAVAGGILGALTSAFNLSREDASMYEDRIKAGGILIAVPTRTGDEQEVERVMINFDADNIKMISTAQRINREVYPHTSYGAAHFSEIRSHRRGPTLGRRSTR